MIPLLEYQHWCEGLVDEVNTNGKVIDHLFLSVKEEHLIKKLKDATGVILCGNFPDATCVGEQDEETDTHDVFFFVLIKSAPGKHTIEGEMEEYAHLQQVMLQLRRVIRTKLECGCLGRVVNGNYKIEWEYQIFGGYNGLSIGFRLKDCKYD